MSIKIMSQVWELELDHSRLLVLLALADHADDHGRRCYPSVDYTAWKVGYSRRQVQRVLRQLIDGGLLRPVAHEAGGRGFTTEYHLYLGKGAKKTPFVRSERVPSATEKGAISDTERVPSETPKGATAMAPQPSRNHQQESSLESSVDAARLGRAATPAWWGPMTKLPGYKDRDYGRQVQVIEDTCCQAHLVHLGVEPQWIVMAFADYYILNHVRHGWSDPGAALRRNLSREIAKVMKMGPVERQDIARRLNQWYDTVGRPRSRSTVPFDMVSVPKIDGRTAWAVILEHLRPALPHQILPRLEGTELLGVDATTAYVAVPDSNIAEYLNRAAYGWITQVVSDVLGGPKAVEFIVEEVEDGDDHPDAPNDL